MLKTNPHTHNEWTNKRGHVTVTGGSLTELSSSPTALPAGAAPFGIVTT